MKSECPKPEQASSKLLVLTGDSCFLILSAFDIRISSFPNGVGWFVVMSDLSSKRDGERSRPRRGEASGAARLGCTGWRPRRPAPPARQGAILSGRPRRNQNIEHP